MLTDLVRPAPDPPHELLRLPEKGDVNFIIRARDFAARAHEHHAKDGKPCRYGTEPFIVHPDACVRTLIRFGYTDRHQLAGMYLHDAYEDTLLSPSEVQSAFGEKVHLYVHALTDITHDEQGAPLPNRRARQLRTYARLRGMVAEDVYGEGFRFVENKLADRLANLQAAIDGINSHHWRMYIAEHPFFCREVGPAGGDERMWAALDALVRKNPLTEAMKAAMVEYRVLARSTDFDRQFPQLAQILKNAVYADDRTKYEMKYLRALGTGNLVDPPRKPEEDE